LVGVIGRAPRVCFLGTASGDDRRLITTFYDNAWREGWVGSHISLFSMPNIADLREHLLAQDVVWVWGGSVAALLAMWRLHGLDSVFLEVWQSGVVLTGVSAGSICWHVGGTTDSFGPDLRAVTNGLALLPWSNGVHYDSEPVRRPLFQSLIAAGTLPMGYATDDGAGLLYRGTDLVEALTERVDAGPTASEQIRAAASPRNRWMFGGFADGQHQEQLGSGDFAIGSRPAVTGTALRGSRRPRSRSRRLGIDACGTAGPMESAMPGQGIWPWRLQLLLKASASSHFASPQQGVAATLQR